MDDEFFRRLRRLLGRRCRHLGRPCTLLDILTEEAAIVLRCDGGTPPIQTDQFGRALRRAHETELVPLFDTGGGGLSADALDLLAALESHHG